MIVDIKKDLKTLEEKLAKLDSERAMLNGNPSQSSPFILIAGVQA